MLKSFRIPLFLLVTGLIWALFSDAAITFYTGNAGTENEGLLRGLNDVGFFVIIACIIYGMIKNQHNKLVMSEEQYRNMFVSNPNPMWIFHQHSLRFVAVNDAAIDKYGYSYDEFLNMTIKDIRPDNDHNRLLILTRTSKNGITQAGNWKHITKAGTVLDVNITSHAIRFNNQPCKMVMVADVTDMLKKEHELEQAYKKEKDLTTELEAKMEAIKKVREESSMLEEVVDKIQNLVLIVNEDGRITWVNKAFIDFTGYSQYEAVGKFTPELLFGPNTSPESIEKLTENVGRKTFFSMEMINYKKNGEEYWTQLNISPIFDNEGIFRFFISVENIITDRKQRESELKHQHNILKHVAWANSHEIRRPLCSIISLVDLLKQSENDEETRQYIKLLDICTAELDEIVKQNNDKINQLSGSYNITGGLQVAAPGKTIKKAG